MILLASGSATRLKLLENAGVDVVAQPARVDESAIKASMAGEAPRDIADALAQAKAIKVSAKRPDAMTLGCDQILHFGGKVYSKAASREALITQINSLSGNSHELVSAAVICEEGRPVWRAISTAKLNMRTLSQEFVEDYVMRNWEAVQGSIGGYLIEGEGPRLFTRIEGDHFAILGLPLLEILSYLATRGRLQT